MAETFETKELPEVPSTLEYLYQNTVSSLTGLYERIVELIMQREILHVDKTFIKLLIKGTGKCKQAYM